MFFCLRVQLKCRQRCQRCVCAPELGAGRAPGVDPHSLVSVFCSRLDANHISTVPDDSFEGLQQLRHLWLDDNNLTKVPVGSLRHQANLQALTLALNRIFYIPDNAFANLSSLVVL